MEIQKGAADYLENAEISKSSYVFFRAVPHPRQWPAATEIDRRRLPVQTGNQKY
jgi:hypothetical protein